MRICSLLPTNCEAFKACTTRCTNVRMQAQYRTLASRTYPVIGVGSYTLLVPVEFGRKQVGNRRQQISMYWGLLRIVQFNTSSGQYMKDMGQQETLPVEQQEIYVLVGVVGEEWSYMSLAFTIQYWMVGETQDGDYSPSAEAQETTNPST